MRLEQKQWKAGSWAPSTAAKLSKDANLVLIFADRALLQGPKLLKEVRAMYPNAHHFGCSTSGEIHGSAIHDESLSLVAIHLERTPIKHAEVHLKETANSFEAGKKLAASFDQKDLTHVMVLSVGVNVNGAEIVKGLSSSLPKDVAVTGGLAGDQTRFQETVVIAADGTPSDDLVSAVAFYGRHVKFGHGSLGGWDPFGPERVITKSKGNVLYELDGKSALQLYKSYLGKHAAELPASAQYFPLSVRTKEGDPGLVRTILTVNEKDQSMTSAGDLPEGAYVRMMKANLDRLVEGAKTAAERALLRRPQLAILISCIGRRMVLRQRTEEEVENAREIYGKDAILTGFYSYGEISPYTPTAKCELHNQTMTITTMLETMDDREAA